MLTTIMECAPGILLVDKPPGCSSFSMVRSVRRLVRVKKVGHAGTLDPFATGLLVVCIGRQATRMVDELMVGEKTYLATVALGQTSSTHDPEGVITTAVPWLPLAKEQVLRMLAGFCGEIMQIPPPFSALKHRGKPLYHYARQGITIEKPPRPVHIHDLQWLDEREQVSVADNELHLLICCSKGTYIRTLAADIGSALGCGAYLSALRRTKSGCFSVEDSLPGDLLSGENGADLIRKTLIGCDEAQKRLQYFKKEDNIVSFR